MKNTSGNGKKANNTKKENAMETKKMTKEEKEQRSAAYQQKRYENALKRYDNLVNYKESKGVANRSLKEVHGNRAINVTTETLIEAVITLIKEVARVSSIDKRIVGVLKKEAANIITKEAHENRLFHIAIYIDDKGKVKDEALYRLVCSTSRNEELKTLLRNIKKEAKKQ